MTDRKPTHGISEHYYDPDNPYRILLTDVSERQTPFYTPSGPPIADRPEALRPTPAPEDLKNELGLTVPAEDHERALTKLTEQFTRTEINDPFEAFRKLVDLSNEMIKQLGLLDSDLASLDYLFKSINELWEQAIDDARRGAMQAYASDIADIMESKAESEGKAYRQRTGETSLEIQGHIINFNSLSEYRQTLALLVKQFEDAYAEWIEYSQSPEVRRIQEDYARIKRELELARNNEARASQNMLTPGGVDPEISQSMHQRSLLAVTEYRNIFNGIALQKQTVDRELEKKYRKSNDAYGQLEKHLSAAGPLIPDDVAGAAWWDFQNMVREWQLIVDQDQYIKPEVIRAFVGLFANTIERCIGQHMQSASLGLDSYSQFAQELSRSVGERLGRTIEAIAKEADETMETIARLRQESSDALISYSYPTTEAMTATTEARELLQGALDRAREAIKQLDAAEGEQKLAQKELGLLEDRAASNDQRGRRDRFDAREIEQEIQRLLDSKAAQFRAEIERQFANLDAEDEEGDDKDLDGLCFDLTSLLSAQAINATVSYTLTQAHARDQRYNERDAKRLKERLALLDETVLQMRDALQAHLEDLIKAIADSQEKGAYALSIYQLLRLGAEKELGRLYVPEEINWGGGKVLEFDLTTGQTSTASSGPTASWLAKRKREWPNTPLKP